MADNYFTSDKDIQTGNNSSSGNSGHANKVPKKFRKIILLIFFALAFLIVISNSCSVVKEGERGVKYTFGRLSSGVLTPGMQWHAPFISGVKKFKIIPRTIQVNFSYGSDAAVTSDMQSVGCDISIIYRYQESGIIKIATEYSDEIIRDNLTRLLKSSVKSVIGKYSIYDLTSKQNSISLEAKDVLIEQVERSNYPVVIDNVVISNWDWSSEFDRKIQDRMNATENALKAERELKLVEINSQKIVKEAEAKKSAAEKDAEAMIVKAEAEAKAKQIKADADAYEAQKIAENFNSYQKQWDYNINLERAKRWNGKEVPDAAYVTFDGKVTPLSMPKTSSNK